MLEGAAIDQIGVFVGDYAAGLAFYKDTLGLPPAWESAEDGNAGFRAGTTLLIIQEDPDQAGAGGPRLYLTVEDIAEARAHLVAAGVACSEVYDLDAFSIVNFADPDGTRLGLFAPAPAYLPTLHGYLGREPSATE
jgi:catechol 2,3-dioxygenase-like lactoylglutathione lyase family enzyme